MIFVLTFGSYNNIQNVFCSYSATAGTASGRGQMLPESPLRSVGELVVRETHTLVSLWDPYAARWRDAAGALALTGGGEAVPAGPQTHGQSPLPQPARTRLPIGPVVAAPGQWREGWDATFLRPSQVHVIEARRGEMVWVGSRWAGPNGSKGIKASSWGHSAWRKTVWEARGWVNSCSWEARSEGIHNHATSPTPEGVQVLSPDSKRAQGITPGRLLARVWVLWVNLEWVHLSGSGRRKLPVGTADASLVPVLMDRCDDSRHNARPKFLTVLVGPVEVSQVF